MKRTVLLLTAIVLTIGAPLPAQWLTQPTKGIPRTPDGKPNLSAPAPKTADGKPDLSGMWEGSFKYLANLAADLKPEEVPLQPWAAALVKERVSLAHAREESPANCLPSGVPRLCPESSRTSSHFSVTTAVT